MAPPKRDVRIAIIGAGLSGMVLAIELKKRLGIESFTIYEKMKDVGGTWRDNYYPGCACDVPSHWYSLSTELNPDWSQKFSSQPEIQRYWKSVFEKHNLAKHTRLDCSFVEAIWNDKEQGYTVEFRTGAGETFFVKPHGMKGLENFKGETFHSARWRKDIQLAGKRVGVIGNGCSATQFIPIISEDKSTEVLNFSRSPSWFMPRPQKTYSGFTKALFRYVPGVMRTYRNWIAMTSDARFIVWLLKMAPLRHYVEETASKYIVDTAPKKYHNFLIPKYPFGCKRVILDPGYLACLHRANVDLVTDPIVTVTENGILCASGKEHELDVIILATGFDVSATGLGLNVYGRDGKTVTEQWASQGGPQGYLGTSISNYPNFYTILGPNVASGTASVVYSTEAQVNLIVKLVQPMVEYGVTSFEPKLDSELTYNREIQARLKTTVWDGGCTSYYKLGNKIIATFPGTTTEFWWRTRNPIWEDYTQIGGRKRMAIAHRFGQLKKLLLLLGIFFFLRRWGWTKIKSEAVNFLLARYQDVSVLRSNVTGVE